MKCPHCQVEIHKAFEETRVVRGYVGAEDGAPTAWFINSMQCPACAKAILCCEKKHPNGFVLDEWCFYPRNSSRPNAQVEVPLDIAEDFNEAAQVLSISPKASAALSRRCLQAVLRHQGFVQKDLAPAIQAAIDKGHLPPALSDNLDAVRNIGNFAAHPMKNQGSGAIVSVEPDEAEWNLDVLEGLFNHYYVQPAKNLSRRAALNEKLIAAKKPPLK